MAEPLKKQRQSLLGKAISPVAIGLYITLFMAWLTIPYYSLASRTTVNRSKQNLPSLLYLAHQKSIDYRLRARGPRPPLKNLALLAADDRSVKTLGRWPWSRDVYASALEKAFQGGAKIIALDMLLSEPSLNPANEVLRSLPAGHADIANFLKSFAPQTDQDKILGANLKKYTDRIVTGSLYANSRDSKWPPETEFCRDLIFKRTQAFKQWDKEEVLLSINDPYHAYMPHILNGIFNDILTDNETELRKRLPAPKDHSAEVLNDNAVTEALHEVCNTILTEFKDDINTQWEIIVAKENPKDFNFANYEAWLKDYRSKVRSNAVEYAEDWAMNTPEIASGTKHTGFFNTWQDPDGTIREEPLLARSGGSYFPSLSLKTYLTTMGYNASPRLEYNPASGEKEVVDFEITNNEDGKTVAHVPTDREGRLLINYAGPAQMFPYLSFADLLSDEPDALIEQTLYDPATKEWRPSETKVKKSDFLKDKILIAGATATGIFDLRVTPFQENYPGTETHLNALENLFTGHFLRTPPDEAVYMPILLLVLGIVLSVLLSWLGAIPGALLAIGTLLTTVFVDQRFLFNRGLVVSVIWPIFLTGSLYVILTFYRYLTEERGKKELRQTFQKYVSPAIVEEILAHPDNVELGGRKVHITMFFSDVRGFTTISEKLDPRALSDLLNSYLTPMTDIVFKNRGTLDKYMGDAIMAFFGAPIGYDDHAKWACRCALESLEKLFELQKEYERKGLPTIDIGIGLNTGEVSVGNMGSKSVRSYTVMGDAVNLASRLEGINKTYGTRIILSEFTFAQVKDSFICREVDWVRVKGKAQPVKIYELIAEIKGDVKPSEALKLFTEGYLAYHSRQFEKGLEKFNAALDLSPRDELAKLYIQRCQDYIDDPPEPSWDGVYTMKTK